jgi:hypothetical protein
VPVRIRQKIFKEYGMAPRPAAKHEFLGPARKSARKRSPAPQGYQPESPPIVAVPNAECRKSRDQESIAIVSRFGYSNRKTQYDVRLPIAFSSLWIRIIYIMEHAIYRR